MLRKRIIPLIQLDQKKLVKTCKFTNPKYIGDPLNAIKIFNDKFVDELIIVDISQNKINRDLDFDFLENLFSECFMPVTYGGGITNIDQAKRIMNLGAEKICLNSSVIKDFKIILELSKYFGSQSIVVSVDVKKNFFKKYQIYNNKFNRFEKKLNLNKYLKDLELAGAGEILINSMNNDGVMKGMDEYLIDLTKDQVNIPIIYLGGIGTLNDIKNIVKKKVNAISAGSFFVFYGELKAVLISYPSEEFEKFIYD